MRRASGSPGRGRPSRVDLRDDARRHATSRGGVAGWWSPRVPTPPPPPWFETPSSRPAFRRAVRRSRRPAPSGVSAGGSGHRVDARRDRPGGGDRVRPDQRVRVRGLLLSPPVADGPLRPFTADQEGMRVGEGYAAFVLEREQEARRRGVEPVADPRLGRFERRPSSHPADSRRLRCRGRDGRGARRPRAVGASRIRGRPRPRPPPTTSPNTRRATGVRRRTARRSGHRPQEPDRPHPRGGGAIELAVAIAAMERGRLPATANAVRDDEAFPDWTWWSASRDRSRHRPRWCSRSASVAPTPRSSWNARDDESRPASTAASPRTTCDHRTREPVAAVGRASHRRRGDRRSRRRPGSARLARFSVLVGPRRSSRHGTPARGRATVAGGGRGGRLLRGVGIHARLLQGTNEDGLGAGNPLHFAEAFPTSVVPRLSLGLGLRGTTISVSGTPLAGFAALHLASTSSIGAGRRGHLALGEEADDRVDAFFANSGSSARSGSPRPGPRSSWSDDVRRRTGRPDPGVLESSELPGPPGEGAGHRRLAGGLGGRTRVGSEGRRSALDPSSRRLVDAALRRSGSEGSIERLGGAVEYQSVGVARALARVLDDASGAR